MRPDEAAAPIAAAPTAAAPATANPIAAAPIAAKPIAAILGGPGTGAADRLAAFARRRQAEGVPLAGVILPPDDGSRQPGGGHHHHHGHGHGDHGGHDGCGCGGALLDLTTGEIIGIHQNLGPGSEACSLDTQRLAGACAGVEREIAAGAKLVVLARFGGQEAERGGLMAAFQAAVSAGVPVACVVTPKAMPAWEKFAGELAVLLPAEAEALEVWWRAHAERHGLVAA
ncbi:hypothetical protein A33M_0351 [Rhodovulum sp. PH10]|uniref:DUF2478 domain-containing protein n=1 Tax=Rhodovulum sp. PH10 TaxID=1187851 RepID=UPI00027C22FC|nr:DUF2478 domain-containing protein [Rhodovulum sp. PH10]EJW13192.1 hypothetical protein A33M_0351 [Rhodovulum sp. PH10]